MVKCCRDGVHAGEIGQGVALPWGGGAVVSKNKVYEGNQLT